MKVNMIDDIDRDEAEEQFNKYTELLKTRNEKWIKQLQTSYKYLKDGKQILDMYEVFKKCPIKNSLPTLALARADMNKIVFQRIRHGGGGFGEKKETQWGSWKTRFILRLPKGTFKNLKEPEERFYDANVPVIPAEFIPKLEPLSKYFILFEVKEWSKITEPPKRDPILLKRISENLFVVLAVWELSKLEQSLIRKK